MLGVPARFLERIGEGWRLTGELPGQLILMPRVTGVGNFLADAPPERVLQVMQVLAESPMPRAALDRSPLRNALACATALGLANTDHGMVHARRPIKDAEASLAESLGKSRSFQIVLDLIRKSPDLSPTQIGKGLSEQLGLIWSDASYLRRGNAFRRWVQWYSSHTL